MKFFVSVSSIATSKFSSITNSPSIKHFDAKQFNSGVVIPKNLRGDFNSADVVVINGTWGNDLRKNLYLKKSTDTGEFILNSPDYRHLDGSISYKIRSAILDEINTCIINLATELEKPVVVFESSTISRAEKNYDASYNLKSKFRMGLGSWMYKKAEWLKPNELDEISKINCPRLHDHKWSINENGSIYILTGLETDPTSTIPVYDFIFKTISTIRNYTDRRIVIKIHPGSPFFKKYLEFETMFQNVFLLRENIPLNKLYNDMYCAVIDNSTSIFELIDAGIPTYCSEINFGHPLKNVDINTINNPYLATKEEVLSWTNEMCCTEFPMSVFKNNHKAVDIVKQLVRKKRHDL